MSEEKIPTAERLIVKVLNRPIGNPGDYLIPTELVMTLMRDFAKLHVQAALEAASEQAKMVDFEYIGTDKEEEMSTDSVLAGSYDEPVMVSKKSILTAYPLENIK